MGLLSFSRLREKVALAKQGSDEGCRAAPYPLCMMQKTLQTLVWRRPERGKNPHPTPLRGATFSHKWEKGLRSPLTGPSEPFVFGNHFDSKFARFREL
jgi:hypothetical protein